MGSPTTEKLHDKAVGLDLRPLEEVAGILGAAQVAAARAVLPVSAALADGARAMAGALRSGGRLYYVGAGSSGLMAAADALELGGTFGIPESRVRILMAGGQPTSAAMPGGTEDAADGLDAGLAELGPNDTVIAVAASGATPYTLEAVRIAKTRGARVIAIANNPGSPLLEAADIPVALETPPEVISGSTRLGAATAQKIALNCMSTLMGVEIGAVHDGMMVNVVADNTKLRGRAAKMVARITGADAAKAEEALAATGGEVKPAVLLAAGAPSAEAARAHLSEHDDHLRRALAALGGQD